jgi:hypothetical protein
VADKVTRLAVARKTQQVATPEKSVAARKQARQALLRRVRRQRAVLAKKTGIAKPPDTVGELQNAELCVSHMPSLKAKKLGTLAQEKVLLEP